MPEPETPTPSIATAAAGLEQSRIIVASEITMRQRQCLHWMMQGKSATDIGCILGISGRTVEKHIIKLCAILGVRTRLQAVLKARDLGLFGASDW